MQHCTLFAVQSNVLYRLIPESKSEDDQRGEDDDGDEVGEAADLDAVIGECEEELAAARPGHRIRIAAKPLLNGCY